MSLFLAFAAIYPDNQVLVFFFLPIKIKWLALLDALYFIFAFFAGGWPSKLAILFALLNIVCSSAVISCATQSAGGFLENPGTTFGKITGGTELPVLCPPGIPGGHFPSLGVSDRTAFPEFIFPAAPFPIDFSPTLRYMIEKTAVGPADAGSKHGRYLK